jgi:hypothetical protein
MGGVKFRHNGGLASARAHSLIFECSKVVQCLRVKEMGNGFRVMGRKKWRRVSPPADPGKACLGAGPPTSLDIANRLSNFLAELLAFLAQLARHVLEHLLHDEGTRRDTR